MGPSMLGRRIELLCNIVDVKGRVILFGAGGILVFFLLLALPFLRLPYVLLTSWYVFFSCPASHLAQ